MATLAQMSRNPQERRTRSRSLAAMLGAAVLALSSSAFASSVDSLSSGFPVMTGLGLDPSYASQNPSDEYYDWLQYEGLPNPSIDLAPNVPTQVQVNTYIFTSNVNAYTQQEDTGSVTPWTISIDGGPAQTVNQTYDILISYSDTITVSDGNPLIFNLGAKGTLFVDPLGFTANAGNNATPETPVYAIMTLVPNPASVPLPAAGSVGFGMLAGFGALFGLRKRFSRRQPIA